METSSTKTTSEKKVKAQSTDKQVLIRLEPDVHMVVNMLSAASNTSIRQYVEEAVLERVRNDLKSGVGARAIKVLDSVGKGG